MGLNTVCFTLFKWDVSHMLLCEVKRSGHRRMYSEAVCINIGSTAVSEGEIKDR